MLATKEQKEALLNNYVYKHKTQEECSAFIDGMYAMYRLMSESKIEELTEQIEKLKKDNNE